MLHVEKNWINLKSSNLWVLMQFHVQHQLILGIFKILPALLVAVIRVGEFSICPQKKKRWIIYIVTFYQSNKRLYINLIENHINPLYHYTLTRNSFHYLVLKSASNPLQATVTSFLTILSIQFFNNTFLTPEYLISSNSLHVSSN